MRRFYGASVVAALLAWSGCSPNVSHPTRAGAKPPPTVIPSDGDPLNYAGPPDPARSVRHLAPPPITGGTLAISRDGTLGIAADPDRDRLFVVDLVGQGLLHSVELEEGDEPGRLVEDESGRVHVALRGGGAVASIDLATGAILGRHALCGAPRGIDYSLTNHRLTVACAGGELISFSPDDGTVFVTMRLGADLRDVVVHPDHSMDVTTFRGAQVFHVFGDVVTRMAPADFDSGEVMFGRHFTPEVAYRARAFGNGIMVVHQRAQSDVIEGTYGDGQNTCGSVVHTAVSVIEKGQPVVASGAIDSTVLPVDFAVSPTGSVVAIVAAGIASDDASRQIRIQFVNDVTKAGDCLGANQSLTAWLPVKGQPTALAWADDGALWVQTREPATLQRARLSDDVFPQWIAVKLSDESRADAGHDFFHTQSGTLLACASCHPEGGEDGHLWQLQNFPNGGPRRTQSLRSQVLARAPFHWTADLATVDVLLDEVFVKRMGGKQPTPYQSVELGSWLNTVRRVPLSTAANSNAAARGKTLFFGNNLCSACHSGKSFTNLAVLDVGTGGMFKVPSLIGVGQRAPFMHDGCAATLTNRFGPCGGSAHADTSQLTPGDVSDLVAYLETL